MEIKYTTRPCMVCGKASEMVLSKAAVQAWQGGEYVQTAFPEMLPDEREMLISGTHPACWDVLFSDEED